MTCNKWIKCGELNIVELVLIVSVFNVQNVCSEAFQSSTHLPSTGKQSVMLLKICGVGATVFDFMNGIVEIPTFSTKPFSYDLEKYKIDSSNQMSTCPNGETLTDQDEKSTLTKAEFDRKFEMSNFSTDVMVKEILRTTHLLYDNGYLSVGNSTAQTAEYYSTDEFCIASIKGKGIQTTVEFKTCSFPKTRPTLQKCCPLGMMLGRRFMTCVEYNGTERWNPSYMDANTKKILGIDAVNPVYKSTDFSCDLDFLEVWTTDDCSIKFHPVTDNTIGFITASRTWDFIAAGNQWCLDAKYSNGRQQMRLLQCLSENIDAIPIPPQVKYSYLYMITMYIGAFFHLMTTVVHLVTWKKQNIHGRTLCSCTASLFFMDAFLGTAHLMGILQVVIGSAKCVLNGIAAHYFAISAFTWILVLNFDLWRTISLVRMESTDGLKRIILYSLVGWGFPLLVSVISVSLNFSFKCPVSGVTIPAYGQSNCFVASWAQGLYLFYIQGALIGTAVVLAVLTMYETCKWKKNAATLRSNKRSAERDNVLLFLKLSVVMGFTWIFDAISWIVTKQNENHIGWLIIDMYNFLSGILIFVIFVCKIETLRLLEQTIPVLTGITDRWTNFMSTFSGDSTVTNISGTSADESRNILAKAGNSEKGATVRYIITKDKDYGSASNEALE